jgi:hypothetical protein
MSDEQAAHAYGVSVRSIEHLRQRLVEEGLEAALGRKKQVRPSVERIFDGQKEAKLIAIACGPKPPGRTRWTLELLADRVVKLKIVEACSPKHGSWLNIAECELSVMTRQCLSGLPAGRQAGSLK